MNKKIFLLYATVFINIMSFGMIFPLIPLFAENLHASNFEVGLIAAAFSISQFLFSPIMGRLSDRFGRKPLLTFSVASAALSFFIAAVSQNLELMYISRLVHGISSAASYPIAVAYIADITTKEKRAEYVGKVSAMFAFGFMFGPVAGGILGNFGLSVAFVGAGFVSVANLFLVWFLLPESISIKTEKLVLRQGLFNFKEMYHGLRGDSGVMFYLLFAWAFYVANFSVAIPLFTHSTFGLGTVGNGIFFSVTGATAALTQWFILPRIVKKYNEVYTILIGLVLMIVGQILAPTTNFLPFFYAFFIVSIMGSGLKRPTVNAILSKSTHAGQGATMGLAFSFEGLGRIVGPLVTGATISTFGLRFPFWLTSAVLGLGLILFYKYEVKKKRHSYL